MAAVGPVADQMAFWVVSEGPVATAEAESLPEPPLKVEPDDRRSSSSGGIEDAERGGLGGPAQDGGGEGVSLWLKMRLFCWRRKWRLLGLAVFLAVIIVLAICHDQVMVVWRAYSSWLEANVSPNW